jgi:uncharacterized membrane protein YphA (DoxX/SURF4 family)
MSDTTFGKIIILLLTLLAAMIFIFSGFGKQQGKVYDCSMAEFHPDYPVKVREECRRLRYQDQEKRIQV